MIKHSLSFFIFLFFGSSLLSQDFNLGVPMLQTFSKEVTKAGSQFSDMVQDSRGVMYFANHDGLLIFDGTTWEVFSLPNYTIVRSLGITKEGHIYVGGQNEFGRFFPNEKGIWQFESLRHLIPESDRNFEDVWDIEINDQGVFFRASNKLFRLYEEKIQIFYQGTITSLQQAGGQIFVQDIFSGLYYFSNNKLEKIDGSETLALNGVEGIIKQKDGYLIATLQQGFYKFSDNKFEKWQNNSNQFLIKNHILEVTPILGNRIAIGTEFGGVIIIDSLGNSIHHLHKGNGLLSNNFQSMFFDKSKNLWIGLANGINYIHTNSPFSRIFPDKDQDGIGYDTKIHDGKIYFATNKGLYFTDWKEQYNSTQAIDFQDIESLRSQVWGLDIVDDKLLVAHNRGAYTINDEKTNHFYNPTGIWSFEKLINSPNRMVAGSYYNLIFFEKENENWKTISSKLNLNESSRFVEQDQFGNFWVAHPYRGIYKISFSDLADVPKVELFGKDDGLPTDILNHLFKIKNELVFCGEHGVFNFNYEANRFEPNNAFTKTFGEKTKVRRLVEAPNGDIWFITKEEFGILKIVDKGLEKKVEKVTFPFFKQEFNQGFESIYPYDENNVFITNDRGFVHYHPSKFLSKDTTFNVLINEIKITSNGDSIISKGLFIQDKKIINQQSEDQIKTFTYDLNDFHFSFSSTDFVSGKATQYRFFLEGDDNDWLDWQNGNTKEYTNLSPGKYTFHVQAKNNFHTLSNIMTYQFRITPPWYASKLAYFLYSLLMVFGVASVVRVYRKKYFGLKEDHEQIVKQSEETIGKLKAEKIETELAFKQRELVSTTLNLVKKNETISNIKEQLKEIKKEVKEKEPSHQIEKLIKKLKLEEIQDENWEQVMFHFNQLNKNFFDRLKSEYTTLTPKDLKMCAYLRMNLSTKEMTSLLNVTTRGVEASRYRLRKKFELEKEQNLTEFLMSF